jgi:hypothetical protein
MVYMHVARIVYEKYYSGASISNKELQESIEFFTKLEKDLRAVGPAFRIAANEVSRVLASLESFDRARADKGGRG